MELQMIELNPKYESCKENINYKIKIE